MAFLLKDIKQVQEADMHTGDVVCAVQLKSNMMCQEKQKDKPVNTQLLVSHSATQAVREQPNMQLAAEPRWLQV